MEIFQNQDTSIQNEAIIPDSEIAKFKKKRFILATIFIGLAIIICSIYFFFQKHKLYTLELIIIDIIIGIFFIQNENKYFIHTSIINGVVRGIFPSTKYGVMFFTLYIVLEGISYFGYQFSNFYSQFILILGVIFIINGILLNTRHSNTDLTILHSRKKKYGITLIIVIIIPLIYSLFNTSIPNLLVIDIMYYYIMYYYIIITSIFSILFLTNENKLAIVTFTNQGNQIQMVPGIKYGFILFIFILLPILIKLVLIFSFNQDLFSILPFLGVVVYLLLIIIAYLINGNFLYRMTVCRNSDVSQRVFVQNNGKIRKFIFITLPIILLCIIFFGPFIFAMFLAGAGYGH